MNRFFYVLFISVIFLFSCSGIDETSDLGKNIIYDKSYDSLKSGVYNTITLRQSTETFGSVSDTLSGKHIFVDSLTGNGKINSSWAVGNWKTEETILKLSHRRIENGNNPLSDTLRISNFLFGLLRDTTVIDTSIKVEIIWENIAGNNAFDEAAVEVGAIFNDTNYFPLNFAKINSKNNESSIPLNIETYLLDEKRDSTIIKRFNTTYTNFVDTVSIDTTFRKNAQNKWEYLQEDTVLYNTADFTKRQYWKNDTLISWKHFIAPSFFDSVLTEGNNIKLFKKIGSEVSNIGNITHKTHNKENSDTTIIDTLIIDIDTVFLSKRNVEVRYNDAYSDNDSILHYTKLISNDTPDTLIQIGYTDTVVLNDPQKGLRTIGDENLDMPNVDLLSDTLNMYLRIDNASNVASILHLFPPALRISYKKISGKDTIDASPTIISFTEKSIITKSSDELQNTVPVISGALERFAEINLNLADFFNEIQNEKFLSVGLADLTLPLNDKTDFPAQYGDSIRINAIISDKKLTPESLYALPPSRLTNTAFVKRDSTSVKISLINTLTDFIYRNKIFENGAPSNAYLYLWLDSWTMGRIWFEPSDAIFTYILQTRKDGE